MTLFLYIPGNIRDSSEERRLSIPGKREEDPVSIMLEVSSLRMLASRIWERECWTSWCSGSVVMFASEVLLSDPVCKNFGNDSAKKSSCIL